MAVRLAPPGTPAIGPAIPVYVVPGGGILDTLAYTNKVLQAAPANLIQYLPMAEPSGTTAQDASGNGRTGAYTGVTLGVTGIGDGRTAASFDGATSFNNALNAAAAFNGPEGTIALWMKVASAGVWSDGVLRRLFHLTVDANNQLSIFKSTAANRVDMIYLAGSVTKTVITTGLTSTDYIHFGLTWSKSGDAMKAYVAGVQSGATQNGLGVWAGVPTLMIVGAGSLVPANVINGIEAHYALWNTPLTAAQMLALATVQS